VITDNQEKQPSAADPWISREEEDWDRKEYWDRREKVSVVI